MDEIVKENIGYDHGHNYLVNKPRKVTCTDTDMRDMLHMVHGHERVMSTSSQKQ